MMKKMPWLFLLLFTVGLTSCSQGNETDTTNPDPTPTPSQSDPEINSYISLFEIPATDISRAINFYQTILDIEIEQMEIPGMEMGILPYEDQVVTGVIIKGEGYQPSADGVTIYLDGGDDLQPILDRIEPNGGEILIPKTAHADESGFFAVFIDSEGNRLGLNSPN